MVYAFALGAGLCYALASVLQHRVAAQQAPSLSLRPRLILELVKHPMWCFGVALDVGAYLLEAAALSVGSIVVVQPLLVSGLLFALPLSALGGPLRPGRQEWVAAVAVALGIAVFCTVGAPSGGSSTAPIWQWAIVFGVCGSFALTAIFVTRNAPPHHRALGLAFATGAAYACTAALTKSVVDTLGADGVAARLQHLGGLHAGPGLGGRADPQPERVPCGPSRGVAPGAGGDEPGAVVDHRAHVVR